MSQDKLKLSPKIPATQWIYGIHAVTAALQNPNRNIKKLLVTKPAFKKLNLNFKNNSRPEFVDPKSLDSLLPAGSVHQGVCLLAEPLKGVALNDALANMPQNACVVLLDQVTDPQNVGAIIRSAAAFGAKAVILQERHSPSMTGALAKSASGALELLPIIRVTNLSRSLNTLKDANFWSIGLENNADKLLNEMKTFSRTALVLGSEGTGLRRLTARNCNELARLPTKTIHSTLNVSAAGAAALYEIMSRQNKSV